MDHLVHRLSYVPDVWAVRPILPRPKGRPVLGSLIAQQFPPQPKGHPGLQRSP